ncbi:MAG: cation diffusion facilitator family transporter [Firmicutes bacterium]|nr:cation diffusion facilitator family transporter [Bacillota bacterium]
MDSNLKLEKKILRISLAGSIAFLVGEVVFALITRSMAILMDCVYDLADLVMIGPFLALVPLLYRSETEKRPYGFSQVESLFVLIKYMILLALDAVLIVESIQLILAGGNRVNASAVAYFELAVSLGCFLMYLMLSRMNKKFSTPSLKAELFIWKLDAASTLAVGLAFVLGLILSHTKFAFIVPYVDPGIAVILAIVLIKEPVTMIVGSIRNLMLFAPEKEIFEQIHDVCEKHMRGYDCKVTFLDVIRTGRKLWVNLYFKPDTETIHLTGLKAANQEITKELKKEFENISMELIPDIDYVHELDGERVSGSTWRKDKLEYINVRESRKQKKKADR